MGFHFQTAQYLWLYHLICSDSEGCSAIYGLTSQSHLFQQQFTHRKLEGGEPNFSQSTSLWSMFLNSKMPFGSGFVFSQIHTTEMIFYQLLLSLDRSLKLIWIVSLYATSLLPCKGYGVKNFSLIWTHLFFPKQDIQWTCKIFFCFKIATTCLFSFCFFPHEMG